MTLEELSAIADEMPAGHRYFLPNFRPVHLWPHPPYPREDNLTVEQRTAQWAAAHNVQVWEQHDPQGVMMQKRTLTGRTPSQPEMQHNAPKTLRDQISNPAAITTKGMDFAEIEKRVLAAMVGPCAPILIDFETYQSDPFELLRDYCLADVELERRFTALKQPMATVALKEPPVKQNGRSAAYLAHDRTKRHRR